MERIANDTEIEIFVIYVTASSPCRRIRFSHNPVRFARNPDLKEDAI
jgi:hypothetical protein